MEKKRKDKMEEQKLFIENYSQFDKLHKEIAEKINNSNISIYVALGILELLKQEIILNSKEGI